MKTLKDYYLKFSSYTLITGASSGIGFELAHVFAQKKHNLILVARRLDQLKTLQTELKKKYDIEVEVIAADLSSEKSAQKLFDQIQSSKLKVDGLVNNAGFGSHGQFTTTALKNTQQMIQLNITTLTELTKLFLPAMIENKYGRIMNVASTASFQPGPLMTVYYATKAYVLFFSEGLYEELKDTGVSVTALCPGPTESGFQAAANLKNVPVVDFLKMPSSKSVAEYGYQAMQKGRAVAVHGLMNNIMSSTIGFLPRALARKLVMRLQQKKVTRT